MPEISSWIDSVARYAQERGREHLVPAVCMFGVQMVMIFFFFLGYVPVVLGVAAAEKYNWAPFVGFGVGGLIFFGVIGALQPVTIGYVHGTLRSMRGEGFPLSELTWGFRRLPAAMGIFLATIGAVFLGTLFCYIPGILAGILLGLAAPALADRDAGAMDALTTSFELVRANFWTAVVWWLLMIVVIMAVSFIPLVGSMLSIPLASVMHATAYLFMVRGRDAPGNVSTV